MLKRWIAPHPAVSVACTLMLLAALFATPAGALVLRTLPYLIAPGVGIALMVAERRLRAPLPILWVLTVSVVACFAIVKHPLVRPLQVAIPVFALFATVLIAGMLCFRVDARVRRSASPIVACILVFALLWAPVAKEVRSIGDTGHAVVTDVKTNGALHDAAFNEYGTDYLALMQLIKDKTPESAVIAMPDQIAFPISGNPELANFFAYPRVIKSANRSQTPVFDISGASYLVSIGEDYQNAWPRFAVPVRMYYHAPARNRVTFGALTISGAGDATTIPPTALQPWHTDADRTLEADTLADDGTRTISLIVTGSTTDPWMAPVHLTLANDTTFRVTVGSNAGNNPANDEQAALVAEVTGPGGVSAVFSSGPAVHSNAEQTLALSDLFRRATEYGKARGWSPGPLTVTHIGLDLGWELPLSQTKLDSLVMIEDGKSPVPDGPDSATRLARDAQAQLRAGNASAAIDHYAAALLLRPNDLDTQLALGEAFRAAGRWQDAKQFFTSLLNDHPDDPWIRYSLALAQRELGDRQGARLTLGPVVAGVPVVRITHTDVSGKKAIITATQRSTLTPQGFTTAVTLRYDTGDGSPGEVYASVREGDETLAVRGASGTFDVPIPPEQSTKVWRLYAGSAHATPLDSVTIDFLPPSAPAKSTLWANMLDAQLAAETGDLASARRTYEAIAQHYQGPFNAMAEAALAQLDGKH